MHDISKRMEQDVKQVSMDGIKNLVIDFGGVIVDLTRNRCIEAFAAIGVDVHESLVNNYSHKDMFMQLELGTITPDVFHEAIRRIATQPVTDDQINEAWIAMLGTIPEAKLSLLSVLRQHYRVFLLSNTNSLHWEYSVRNLFSYKQYGIEDFFDKIYLSYELHLLKPEPPIFTHVLTDAGLLAEETLLIDDASVNCRGAESLGIRTYMPEPREDWSFLFDGIL